MTVKISKKYTFFGAVLLLIFISITAPQDSYAQEKSEYEKQQEEKIKQYRKRIKRSKADEAKSNKRERRFLKFNTKNKQGDQPYSGGASKYSRKRRIPSSSTPTVYAQPDPYAFRSKRYRQRKIYSNEGLRLASPSIEKPYSGKIKPSAQSWRDRSRGRINVFPQVNPYQYRKLRSERERISDTQGSFGTDPRDPERPAKRSRIRTSSASGRYIVNRKAKPYKLRDRKKWEETYTGGFYGRRPGITPRNNQKISGTISPDPYSNRGKLGDKPYSGAITGGARFNTATKPGERAWKGDIAGKKLRQKRVRGGNFNVYPSVDPYSNRKIRSERDRISKDQTTYSTDPRDPERAYKKGRVKIRSASGRYIVNRKAKPYKLKDVKKWEETYTGGFYGRRPGIEPKNTQRVSAFISPDPYKNRGRLGDKPYKGEITGNFYSATKRGERAWKGDIAGRKIDYSKPRDTQRSGGFSKRIATASGGLHNNRGRAISSRPPSNIAVKEQEFQGHFKRFELEPGFESGNINYQGNLKARRPLKGGGTISSRMNRNNSGRAILSFTPGKQARKAPVDQGKHYLFELSPGFNDDNIFYQGDIKTKRPLKGGGSLARNDWNNKGSALPKKYGPSSRVPGSFSGNLKADEREKGGGSLARNDWNNKGQSLPRKYGDNTRTPSIFSGNIKASERASGGGSVSRNRWNNNDKALTSKYSGSARKTGSYSGNIRASKPFSGGGSITRTESWNNEETPASKKFISPLSYYMARHQGDVKEKRKNYGRNEAADDNALRARKPEKAYFQAGNFQGNMKRSRRDIEGTKHSSTKFYNAKGDTNAMEEKKKFISLKLLWNKLFNKEEPDKEKEKKPKYDKSEKGLWYE